MQRPRERGGMARYVYRATCRIEAAPFTLTKQTDLGVGEDNVVAAERAGVVDGLCFALEQEGDLRGEPAHRLSLRVYQVPPPRVRQQRLRVVYRGV
jgi:hypothetical protein